MSTGSRTEMLLTVEGTIACLFGRGMCIIFVLFFLNFHVSLKSEQQATFADKKSLSNKHDYECRVFLSTVAKIDNNLTFAESIL